MIKIQEVESKNQTKLDISKLNYKKENECEKKKKRELIPS
jgi:hypothetical protein